MKYLITLIGLTLSLPAYSKEIPRRGTQVEQDAAAESFFQIVQCIKDKSIPKGTSLENTIVQMKCLNQGVIYYGDATNQSAPKSSETIKQPEVKK